MAELSPSPFTCKLTQPIIRLSIEKAIAGMELDMLRQVLRSFCSRVAFVGCLTKALSGSPKSFQLALKGLF